MPRITAIRSLNGQLPNLRVYRVNCPVNPLTFAKKIVGKNIPIFFSSR